MGYARCEAGTKDTTDKSPEMTLKLRGNKLAEEGKRWRELLVLKKKKLWRDVKLLVITGGRAKESQLSVANLR